jgi:ribonuclease HI
MRQGAVKPFRQFRTLHAHVAATSPANGRAGIGIIFVNPHGEVLSRVARELSGVETREAGTFRAILYALWNSRRLGARSVIVHSGHLEAVARLNGRMAVDPELVGPYLEIRALLHTYRNAQIREEKTPWGREAGALAEQVADQCTQRTSQVPRTEVRGLCEE